MNKQSRNWPIDREQADSCQREGGERLCETKILIKTLIKIIKQDLVCYSLTSFEYV